MKIESGKYYRTRGGQVFGPMVRDEDYNANFPWCLVSSEPENSWTEGGRWSLDDKEYPFDFVAEVYVSAPPVLTPPFIHPYNGPNGPFRFVGETKTLRDEFAMETMKILLPKHDWVEGILALHCYKQADAMMEARKK